MSVLLDSVSMGTFTLNSQVVNLGSIAGKLEKRFGDLGYKVETSLEEDSLHLMLGKDELFKKVPGLFPFICATLRYQSDQCDIALRFAKANGLETSMLAQFLTNSTLIIDPCPIPKVPRYDYMVGSLFHKSAQERNVGIFHTNGYGRQIIAVINGCL